MDDLAHFDREEELRVLMEAALSGLHVALPVRVQKDSDGKTVSIKPTITRQQTMPDGTTKEVEYPILEGLPRFASGGGLSTTHPIKADDEGLAIMTSRSYWNWRQLGGTQAQVDARNHDLSDVIYLSGIRSMPRDLKGISKDSTQVRTDDKKSVHDVSHKAITTIREAAAHQVNGSVIQSEIGKTLHHIAGDAIQQVVKKFLHNCGVG